MECFRCGGRMIKITLPACPDAKCAKRATCRSDWYFGWVFGLLPMEVELPQPKKGMKYWVAYIGMVN
jgi:hypothetical protein